MGIPRILPPLVRGKVTGILDFFIDEIIITKNVLYLTENLDLVAQMRWWGEILPACIRPKILQLQGKIISSSQQVEAYSHSVQYEIKTSIDLLKSYLKACEVIEVSVYETVEKYVIGSAFLKNLNNLLNRNNVFISIPIIDYTGEEIGKMKIHIKFFENAQDDENHYCKNKIVDRNLIALGEGGPELLESNYIFSAEKTIIYDSLSEITNFEVEPDQNSLQNKNNTCGSVLYNPESKTTLKYLYTNEAKGSSKSIILPEVFVSSDSSKIVKSDIDLKTRKPGKSNKSKLVNKSISDSFQGKNKSRNEKSTEISTSKDKFSKKAIVRTLSLKKPKLVINQMESKVPHRKPSDESFSNKNSRLKNFSQNCNKKMVFDYLLGSVMTKETEESAVKYFRNMSPSHDVVSSINELCLTSNETEVCATKCIKSNLCFDLNNPIERNYYEKFFSKNNPSEFEISEFLNEPENSTALQKWKSSDRNNQHDDFKIESNRFVDEDVTKNSDNFQLGHLNRVNKTASNCARCKYYKKLDELDTIIESLKHFEKNMLKQEKRLQLDFEDNLSKQGCKVSDR